MNTTCMNAFGSACAHRVTEIPGPQSRRICDILKKHESPSASYIAAGSVPVVWRRAKGANIEDVDGNTPTC